MKRNGFFKIATKYGSKIVAEIENSYIVFLPQRMVQVFAEDSTLFENLRKEDTEKEVFIKYLGGVCNQIEFVSKGVDEVDA